MYTTLVQCRQGEPARDSQQYMAQDCKWFVESDRQSIAEFQELSSQAWVFQEFWRVRNGIIDDEIYETLDHSYEPYPLHSLD